MPKTKVSKKKQPSRVKNAASWLKPTTPLRGLLLFAIVFGLAGGAYTLKRSLAATLTYDNTYNKRFASWSVQPAQKGHCHIEYTGGNYLGVAIVKARIRSDFAGRRCSAHLFVDGWSNYGNFANIPSWSNTSWSSWYSTSVGPTVYFRSGQVQLTNVETGHYDIYKFTIY